jgi:hypothetical protein
MKGLDMMKLISLAVAATIAGISAASAASLSLVGGNAVTFGTGNYKADCSGGITHCYDPSGPAGALTENLTAFFNGDAYPGLSVSGPATVRVTFIGKEAGAFNKTIQMYGGSVSNEDPIGTSYAFTQPVGGTLDFTFRSPKNGGLNTKAGSQGFLGTGAIAFSDVFNNGHSVYAYFDDAGASDDRDWDDMVVQISILPIPAAGLLLLGGVGGLAAVGRRRKKA